MKGRLNRWSCCAVVCRRALHQQRTCNRRYTINSTRVCFRSTCFSKVRILAFFRRPLPPLDVVNVIWEFVYRQLLSFFLFRSPRRRFTGALGISHLLQGCASSCPFFSAFFSNPPPLPSIFPLLSKRLTIDHDT